MGAHLSGKGKMGKTPRSTLEKRLQRGKRHGRLTTDRGSANFPGVRRPMWLSRLRCALEREFRGAAWEKAPAEWLVIPGSRPNHRRFRRVQVAASHPLTVSVAARSVRFCHGFVGRGLRPGSVDRVVSMRHPGRTSVHGCEALGRSRADRCAGVPSSGHGIAAGLFCSLTIWSW